MNSRGKVRGQELKTLGDSRKGKKVRTKVKKDVLKASSIAMKRQAQSQKHAFLRPQPRLRFPLTSAPRITKQRLKTGDRIEVFWDSHGSYFRGTVVGGNDKHFVLQYDDGSDFKHDLNNYKWRFVVLDDAGMETISDSLDVNFDPDDYDSSIGKYADIVENERSRRTTGEPSQNAIESGMFLPLQICKRLKKDCVKLVKRRNG